MKANEYRLLRDGALYRQPVIARLRDPSAPVPWWRRGLRLACISVLAWFGLYLLGIAFWSLLLVVTGWIAS